MKKIMIRYTLLLTMVASIIAGCVDEAENPTFANDEVPRIFDWPTTNMFTMDVTDTLRLDFTVSPADGADFKWILDDEVVGTEKSFQKKFAEGGAHTLKFVVTRNGVENSRSAALTVIENIPFEPKPYNKRVVAFLSRNGTLANVDLDHITHLVITSAVVNAASETLVDTTFTGMDLKNLVKTAHSAGVYVMLQASGTIAQPQGAGLYGDYSFYNAVNDPDMQEEVIATLMKFIADNDLDGLDIYLNNTSEGALDSTKVGKFYRAILPSLPEGPNGKFFYTASVPGGWTSGQLRPAAKVSRMDWVNIHGFRYEDIPPNAPTPHSPYWAFTDLAATWESFGLPKNKIVGGIPAVGFHYFLPDDVSGVGWGNLWMYTAYEGYKNILTRDANAHTKNKLDVDDGIFYDGHPAIQEKAQYVLDQNLGGLMIWTVDNDTQDESKSLVKAAYTALGNP
ncbi:glycosyl hydrolase family 18 protein [Pseudochryseolinea flava]|nr:glycosyl hydrolase family 18 protein [Pseudochryseolinea flava]